MRFRRLSGPLFSSPWRNTVTPSSGRWFPAKTQQTPHVVGQRVLLGQRHVDHWQHGTLAVEDAVQKPWHNDIVDVVGVTEFGDVLCAQLRRRAVQVAWG
jgi:hypothetical protein